MSIRYPAGVRFVAAMLVFICVALPLSGCGNSVKQGNAVSTATPTPTPIPEWMYTPDPALFILKEDGFFEDKYLSVHWPAYLEYKYSVMHNSANYDGAAKDGQRILLSYTPDEGAVFDKELGGLDFAAYQDFLTTQMNEFYYLKEFGYTTIDGHETLRALFEYAPPDGKNTYALALQYSIKVNDWVLGICFTTTEKSFPPEVENSIHTINFKNGY